MSAMRRHLPEYLSEALGLGLFMVSACAFATLLEHPASPVRAALPDATLRRGLMGLAMGLTAIGLIYSPWGRRSGAHMNPATTLAFWRLGHVRGADLAAYTLAQFVGGAAGVALAARFIGPALADPHVHYVVTKPGHFGVIAAFAGEALTSFVLISIVVRAIARPRLMRWTGVIAGAIVALWILLEAPVSGMSMNPARTLASALAARDWTALWVYWIAPPLGMLAAVEAYALELHARGLTDTGCAKLDHAPDVPCIFCGQGITRPLPASGTSSTVPSLRVSKRPS